MTDKEAVLEVLRAWSFWDRNPEPSIPRDVLRSLPPLVDDLVLVIQGVRRCGKSTLQIQIMEHLKLDPARCFFINFEDPRLADMLNPTLFDQILEIAKKQFPTGPLYFFFDEIQGIEDWPKWFHRILHKSKNTFFSITGSNANLLSGKVGSALTGRHITVELFPFSFQEFSQLRKNGSVEDYVRLGGFPRALTYPEPQKLLSQYFIDIIERDVRRHLSLRSTSLLPKLSKMLFESQGSEISQRKLSIPLAVSPDLIGDCLSAIEASYLAISVPYFAFSERQRLARNRKFYTIDNGLRSAVVTRSQPDRGKGLEAAVLLALRSKFREVTYWRGDREVDFVVMDGNRIIPVQVTWDVPQERHKLGLAEFAKAFPDAESGSIIRAKDLSQSGWIDRIMDN